MFELENPSRGNYVLEAYAIKGFNYANCRVNGKVSPLRVGQLMNANVSILECIQGQSIGMILTGLIPCGAPIVFLILNSEHCCAEADFKNKKELRLRGS